MKWFKHISDSLDDPFIYELMDEFGDFGYLAFFGILEIYSREFKPEKGWKLSTTLSFLRSKLHQSSVKRVKNFLRSDLVLKKWNVELDDKRVVIFIPKFTELIDEWTQRKMKNNGNEIGSNSGVTPKILKHDKEERIKKKKKKDNPKKIDADDLLNYLLNTIEDSENGIKSNKEKIVEFYNYRMTMPIKGKVQKFYTQKAVNGLLRACKNCLEKYHDFNECLDISMERNWLLPEAKYLDGIVENKKSEPEPKNRGYNPKTCVEIFDNDGNYIGPPEERHKYVIE